MSAVIVLAVVSTEVIVPWQLGKIILVWAKETETSPGTETILTPRMSLMPLNEKDEAKKKLYQAEADRIELMIYRKATASRDAGRVGDPDLSKMGSNIPTVPPIDWKPTPREGSGLPSGVTTSGW